MFSDPRADSAVPAHVSGPAGRLGLPDPGRARSRSGRRFRRSVRDRRRPKAAPEPLKDEIPPAELDAVMAAHFKGPGPDGAVRVPQGGRGLSRRPEAGPGLDPRLDQPGDRAPERQRRAGRGRQEVGRRGRSSNFDEALQLLAGVLERDPNNRHAHFCRGIILEQQGELAEAHKHFKRRDRARPQRRGRRGTGRRARSPTRTTRPSPPGPRQAKDQVALFAKALEHDPYLTPAIYKLSFAYRLAGQPDKQKELLERWREINPDRQKPVPGPGNSADKVYGEMGRYATVIDPFPRPATAQESAAMPPKFEPARPLSIKLADGDRWATPDDFKGDRAVLGRARARFGAAVSTFDVNGDGKLDVYLAAAIVGPKGLRDALLLNKGDGNFEDVTAAYGLPMDQASLGAAAADFDADRHIDLFLTGVGKNRLLRNRDGKGFEDLTASLKSVGPPAISLAARWLDLDQDGDLDLYVVNYCAAEHAEKAFLAGQACAAGSGQRRLSQRRPARGHPGQPAAGVGSAAPSPGRT